MTTPDFKNITEFKTNEQGEILCLHEGCPRVYSNKYSMLRHYTTHNPTRQYQCIYCSKRFALSQYLKDHYNIHTGAKPYRCDYPGCGESFSQTGKLSQHKRQFHPDYYLRVGKAQRNKRGLKQRVKGKLVTGPFPLRESKK